jgi:hypothetical protein
MDASRMALTEGGKHFCAINCGVWPTGRLSHAFDGILDELRGPIAKTHLQADVDCRRKLLAHRDLSLG